MDYLLTKKLERILSVKPPFICVCTHAHELLKENVLKQR